jgi:endonuclease/exonuclease/phosphatase family metal-dependent hydrolase
VLAALVSSCQLNLNKYTIVPNPNTITIATFNAEWLGDGSDDTKPRTAVDYEKLARIISITDADIIALQEVENEKALEKLCTYLEGYSYYVSETGGKQNPAYLFNNNLEVRYVGDYSPVNVEVGRTRPGFLVFVRKGNFDFALMNVHLKSTSSYDNTEELKKKSYLLRAQQAKALKNWVDSVLTKTKEKDIILTGDFNDNPNRKTNPTLMSLSEDKNIFFTTADLQSCKNVKWDCIDHIVTTLSAKNRIIPNSLHQINFYQILKQKEAESISDHCPVVISFDIKATDND